MPKVTRNVVFLCCGPENGQVELKAAGQLAWWSSEGNTAFRLQPGRYSPLLVSSQQSAAATGTERSYLENVQARQRRNKETACSVQERDMEKLLAREISSGNRESFINRQDNGGKTWKHSGDPAPWRPGRAKPLQRPSRAESFQEGTPGRPVCPGPVPSLAYHARYYSSSGKPSHCLTRAVVQVCKA